MCTSADSWDKTVLTFLILDWRMGCAIVRTGCIGVCSSSVFRRLNSPVDCTLLGLDTAGRWLGSSLLTRLGGLAGLGAGGLMPRAPNGWIELPKRDGGREPPKSLR